MTDAEILLLQGLIGQVLPPLTDLLNRFIPSSNIRFLASLLICLLIGIALNFKSLMFGNVYQLLATATVIWTSSQAAYKLYYDDSKWQNNIRFNSSPLPVAQLIPPISLGKVI